MARRGSTALSKEATDRGLAVTVEVAKTVDATTAMAATMAAMEEDVACGAPVLDL